MKEPPVTRLVHRLKISGASAIARSAALMRSGRIALRLDGGFSGSARLITAIFARQLPGVQTCVVFLRIKRSGGYRTRVATIDDVAELAACDMMLGDCPWHVYVVL